MGSQSVYQVAEMTEVEFLEKKIGLLEAICRKDDVIIGLHIAAERAQAEIIENLRKQLAIPPLPLPHGFGRNAKEDAKVLAVLMEVESQMKNASPLFSEGLLFKDLNWAIEYMHNLIVGF